MVQKDQVKEPIKRNANYTEAQIIRQMIYHENELVNHKITWFSMLQGLLFAALAFSLDVEDAAIFVYLLSLLGTVLSISTFYSIQSGLTAIKTLRGWWDENKSMDYNGPDVIGRRPDSKSIPFLRPYVVFPICFIVAWAFIAIWKIC